MSEPNTRDHLANERTFLAWVRTSIALFGLGVVIAKLRFLMPTVAVVSATRPPAGTRSTLLGLAFAAVGLLTLVFAFLHYEWTRRDIESGSYRASQRSLLALVAFIFLLGLASIAYLMTLAPP
jgi:putative membrane protein